MDIYVTAEFDSVDLADLASGRVRNLAGVTGVEIIPNRFSKHEGGYEASLPLMPTPGFANMGFLSMGTLYPVPVAYGIGGKVEDDIEPNHRHDALLKVNMDDENACSRVTSILRGIGGRSIKVINPSKK